MEGTADCHSPVAPRAESMFSTVTSPVCPCQLPAPRSAPASGSPQPWPLAHPGHPCPAPLPSLCQAAGCGHRPRKRAQSLRACGHSRLSLSSASSLGSACLSALLRMQGIRAEVCAAQRPRRSCSLHVTSASPCCHRCDGGYRTPASGHAPCTPQLTPCTPLSHVWCRGHCLTYFFQPARSSLKSGPRPSQCLAHSRPQAMSVE